MSEVYIKEPGTNGKAVFQTTHGDLEIEMWATECPKACRNFCQLILEGYYNGTTFHRVIKDFLVQGGDGTGTGDGLESIYGSPYPDEIHPRLKFRYRGMMGIASAGKGTKTNGSQFFIVMGRTPTLDGKHTLFAKVVGQTVYNLVRINEVDCDKKDRPAEPPRIIRAELVWDPFGDLEPRRLAPPPMAPKSEKEVHRRAPVKNKNMLSFAGDEDDGDDDDNKRVRKKGGAHDLLEDQRLKKQAAYPDEARPSGKPGKRPAATEEASAKAKRPGGGPARGGAARAAQPKAAEQAEADWGSSADSDENSSGQEDDVALAKSRKRQQEILNLKRGIAAVGHEDDEPQQKKKQVGSAWEEQRAGYKTRQKAKALSRDGKKKADADMMSVMKSFRDRLQTTFKDGGDDDDDEEKTEEKETGTLSAIFAEGEEESDKGWLKSSGLKFHTSGDKAFKMASDKARETLDIFDPLLKQGNAEVLAAEMKKRTMGMQAPHRKREIKIDDKELADPRRQKTRE